MAPSLVDPPPAPLVHGPGRADVDHLLALQTGRQDQPFLTRRIEFKESTRPDPKMDALRRKFRAVNADAVSRDAQNATAHQQQHKQQPLVDPASGFRRAAHNLFRKDRLALGWQSIRPIGPGLHNLGNTCFLNSVLQCLTYTPPLANYLLAHGHTAQCKCSDYCVLCELERHVNRALGSGAHHSHHQQAISPKTFAGRLKAIAKHMRLGRQEDSHEFLRYVVEAMQKSCLTGFDPKMDHRIKETTLVHGIFGGYLQSQIRCGQCQHDSNTFDPFLDLSLEVRHCSSVERALQTFTKPESLSGANKYKCEKCNMLVDARKQMTVYQTPEVLTVQLKRFSFGHSMFDGKINKHVDYPESLDLAPFISPSRRAAETHTRYALYGVLVHSGGSCHSGHYYCYVKSPAGIWFRMDDSSVSQASLNTVLTRSAYLLFYVRTDKAPANRSPAPKDRTASLVSPGQTPVSKRMRLHPDPASPRSGSADIDDQGELLSPEELARLRPPAPPAKPASPATRPLEQKASPKLPTKPHNRPVVPLMPQAEPIPAPASVKSGPSTASLTAAKAPSPVKISNVAKPATPTNGVRTAATSRWPTASSTASSGTSTPARAATTITATAIGTGWTVSDLSDSPGTPRVASPVKPGSLKRKLDTIHHHSPPTVYTPPAAPRPRPNSAPAKRTFQVKDLKTTVKSWDDGDTGAATAHNGGAATLDSAKQRRRDLKLAQRRVLAEIQAKKVKNVAPDAWDRALDRGKGKKARRKVNHFADPGNKFQRHQNNKNRGGSFGRKRQKSVA
ncbi:hypothetical protein IWQ60_002694 [Tieghemiomyces parasiticus]|uniref:Ubiquitin carboxyl-terminal hydrolase n=1 Tax=Tieghemiomyces parasiticus TaxID=78921 RepID=A0A9W8DVG9_9FUNG|nr:hypothetical protein IWQ60_002694 [Tieghemiomyces parasiticus]